MSAADEGGTFGLGDEPKPIGPSSGTGDDGFFVPGERERPRRRESFIRHSKRELGKVFSAPLHRKKSAREKLIGGKDKKADAKKNRGKASSADDEKQQIWSKRGLSKRRDILKRFKERKLWYKTRIRPKEREEYAKKVFGGKARAGYFNKEALKDERKRLERQAYRGKYEERKKAKKHQKLLDEVFGKEKKR
jgi:hypothetical protein